MQQIEIDPVGAQPREAALAGGNHAGARGVVGIDLADDKEVVAQSFGGAGDHLFGAAVAIHLGSVDQSHAELDPEPHGRRLFLRSPAGLTHVPRTLTERRHTLAARQRHHRQVFHHRVPPCNTGSCGAWRGRSPPAARLFRHIDIDDTHQLAACLTETHDGRHAAAGKYDIVIERGGANPRHHRAPRGPSRSAIRPRQTRAAR